VIPDSIAGPQRIESCRLSLRNGLASCYKQLAGLLFFRFTFQKRFLSERAVTKALGAKRGGAHWRRKRADGAELPLYLSANNLKAFVDADLAMALKPHIYMPLRGGGAAPGVLDELRRITPRDNKGRLKHKYFQRLTEDVGHPRLREHLASEITLMRIFNDGEWDQFQVALNRALPKQISLPLFDALDDRPSGKQPILPPNQ
jgi:P63C domain